MDFLKNKNCLGKGLDLPDSRIRVLCYSTVLHLLPYRTSLGKVITVKIKLYRLCPSAFKQPDATGSDSDAFSSCLEDSCLSNAKSILSSCKELGHC